MAKPIIHHRTRLFEEVFEKVLRQLKWVFQTKNEVLVHACVGSGAMEAAIVNCFSPGDKVIVIRSGKFGERWSEQAKMFQLNVVDLDVPWGEAVDLKKFEQLLVEHKPRGVLCQASETSTGVAHPIKELGLLIKKRSDALFLVDAITALGVYDIQTDDWGLDVVITGSQKALMLPPGLAIMSMSEKAWEACEKSKLPKYYFDCKQLRAMQKKNQTFFTPAISLIRGLGVALDMMEEETLPKIYSRHARLARATREAVKAMGLAVFAQEPSNSITAVSTPVDSEKIVSHLLDKYNMSIIGGQDKLKGKIFRVGHMGYCGDFDIISVVGAIEMALKDHGHKSEMGAGVAAAIRSLHCPE